MMAQKQLFRHRPDEGIYGDCHRTAIASIFDLEAKDVPHFMYGMAGKGGAPEAHAAVDRWLAERGCVQINVLYSGEIPVEDVLLTVKNCNRHLPGLYYILGGTSRSGVNHSVVCCDGKIVCDPSQDDAGIVGPCDDGFYWLTFFGTQKTVDQETALRGCDAR